MNRFFVLIVTMTLFLFSCQTISKVEKLTEGQLIEKQNTLIENGNTLLNENKNGLALDTFKEAEKIDGNNVKVNIGIGSAYAKLGKIDLAKPYIKKAYDNLVNNPIDKSIYYHGIADRLAFDCKMYKEAIDLYEIQIKILSENVDDKWLCGSVEHKAYCYYMLGDIENAKKYAIEGFELATKADNKDVLSWYASTDKNDWHNIVMKK